MDKKRICFFLHYYPEESMPLYVKYYINELAHHFNEVRLVTNSRKLTVLPGELKENIQIQFEKNEGYDYGMFYKAFKQINPQEYYQIACVNDSNVLINRLSKIFAWDKTREVDFWGLVDSHERPWFSKHQNSYHIQSHFIVFNEKAISLLQDFFNEAQPENTFMEKNVKQLRRKVINDWELGITQYLLKKGLSHATYLNSKNLLKKHNPKGNNVTHVLYRELLEEGYPLLKKRIVLEKKWNLFYKRQKIKELVSRFSHFEWNMDEAIDELYK